MTDRQWQRGWAMVILATGVIGLGSAMGQAQLMEPADGVGQDQAQPANADSTNPTNSDSNVRNARVIRPGSSASDQADSKSKDVETVELFDPGESKSPSNDSTVEVGSLGQVDMAVKDLDITKALQVLSIQSQKNIIASKNVSGTVTANLYGVGFYDALDAILHPNGYGYEEKGNMIYVYTEDELQKRRKANRQTVHKMIELNYITAKEASTFVSPLLSPDGQIAVSGDVEPGPQPSIGDAGANSSAYQGRLVVVDYKENVNEIKDLIHELDTKPKQVLIEATILQVRLTEDNALGVDFAAFSDLDVEDFTTPLGAADDLIKGEGANGNKIDSGNAITTSAGNVANGQSGVQVGVLGSDAAIFVRALDSVNDTSVLATPKVLALNRQKAEIDVGDKLGYLSTTVTDTSETQTVEFLDVGTQLTLRPFISNDGYIRMELRPTVSDGNTDRVVDGNVIPFETSQTLTSNVLVPNGQTIVLGGLFTEDTSVNTNQIPGLGSIPIVGWLGKGQDDSIQRSEIMFMVKPTIMEDSPLAKMGDDLKNRAMQAIPGARKGLLPWSRTKLTAHYMKEAHQALEHGDKDKALWNTNLALHVDPTMPDARRIKRELIGKELFYHNQSMMDKAVDDVIDSQIGDIDDLDVNDESDEMMDANESSESSSQSITDPHDKARQPATNSNDMATDTNDSEPAGKKAQAPHSVSMDEPLSEANSRQTQPASRDASAEAQPEPQPEPQTDSVDTQQANSSANSEQLTDKGVKATTDIDKPEVSDASDASSDTNPADSTSQANASQPESLLADASGDDPAFEMQIVEEEDSAQPQANDMQTVDQPAAWESASQASEARSFNSARLTYAVWSNVPWFATWQPPTRQPVAESADDPVNLEFSQVNPDHVGE